MERKIALVGTASSGVSAPYQDKSWEIWGVSGRADYVTRADRWFELHRLDGEPHDWASHWRACLKKFGKDIPELVMMYPEPDLHENILTYPHDRITSRFGTYFMTSTFAWMMALAIDELRPMGKKPINGRIAIYGVDMEYGTEYRQQRAGFRHFIQLASHFEIPVERLADGGLCYEPVPYPMWQDDPILAKNTCKRKETLDQLNEFDRSLKDTDLMVACHTAVLTEIEKFKSKGYKSDERTKQLERDLDGLKSTRLSLKEDIACKRGQYEEQSWLNDYLQP